MRLKKLEILCLSLITICSFAFLVGCQDKTTVSRTTTPTTLKTITSIVDNGDLNFDKDGNIIYDNVEIKMWSVTTGDDATTQDEIINEFNTMYNGMIHITTTHTSRYDLETLLTSTMEFDREQAPDLFFSHSSRANEYVEKGWLQPIEQYMNKAGLVIDKADYVPSLLNAASVDGYIYGLPQDVHSAMIVMRKDILTKNGLDIPTDYASLVATCEKAIKMAAEGKLYIRGENSEGIPFDTWRYAKTIDTYFPFPIAFGDMWVHEFLGYTAALQNGGTFIDKYGMPGFKSEETAKGLQLLRDWAMPSETSVNKLPLSKALGSDYDVGNTPFLSGNCIFKLLGPWEYQNDLNTFQKYLKNDGGDANIGTISLSNFFAADSTKEYASKIKGEGHAFMLMDTVESLTKKTACMVFADYMVNNASIKWAKRGHLPSLISVQNSNDYLSDPDYEKYISKWGSCEDYVVIQPTPYYSTIDTYFKNCVQKAMATEFKSTPLSSIIDEEYSDCVDYIDLIS